VCTKLSKMTHFYFRSYYKCLNYELKLDLNWRLTMSAAWKLCNVISLPSAVARDLMTCFIYRRDCLQLHPVFNERVSGILGEYHHITPSQI